MSTPMSSVRCCAPCVVVLAFGSLMGLARAGDEKEPPLLARGAEIFSREWMPGDPRSPGGDGLGPVYNETSCVGCHGMGAPGGAGPINKNAVILSMISTPSITNYDSLKPSRPDSAKAQKILDDRIAQIHPGLNKTASLVLHRFGANADYQRWLQNLLSLGNEPRTTSSPGIAGRQAGRRRVEAISAEDQNGQNALAGRSASLAQTMAIKDSKGKDPITVSVSERNTPSLFGAGLIDAVPASVLEAIAKAQPDGVRGRVHSLGAGRIGRFGWKAQTESLREFVMVACAGELGLEVPGHHQGTSPLDFESKPKGLDLTESDCEALIAYVRILPQPTELTPSYSQGGQALEEGRDLFAKVGCADCHTPDVGDVKGIYSDLLLHNMGQSLSDGGQYYGSESPGDSNPFEWRTPPLWGFRDSAPYLHDGRAETLEEAVAHHDGQSEASSKAFFGLSARSRSRIEAFLKSLVAPTYEPSKSGSSRDTEDSLAARRRHLEAQEKLVERTLAEADRRLNEGLETAKKNVEAERSKFVDEILHLKLAQDEREKGSLWRAESQLHAAEALEKAGKVSGALSTYHEIVARFRNTTQARIAAERIEALVRSR